MTDDKPYQILVGDCLQTLKTLPAKSVQCCITSPPYFRLRDYQTGKWEGGDPKCDHVEQTFESAYQSVLKTSTLGVGKKNQAAARLGLASSKVCKRCGARRVDRQLGQEQTHEEYVANLVAVFREVRRVLRDDGIIWVNLGDSMRKKQLLGIPWRFAFAMQADGWILRDDIIWYAPNKMPESVTDRTTNAHEYVFLLAKQPRYFYDANAIKERAKTAPHAPKNNKLKKNKAVVTGRSDGNRQDTIWGQDGLSNKRSVWIVNTEPLRDAHFAAYPSKLILPMILAGTSEKGCCPKCRAPYRRKVKKIRTATRPGTNSKVRDVGHLKIMKTPGKANVSMKSTLGGMVGNRDPERHVTQTKTIGWEPTCDCNAGPPVPCIVLDPFLGSGTTVAVAVRRNRCGIGCELNPEYVKIGLRRIKKALRKKGFGLV